VNGRLSNRKSPLGKVSLEDSGLQVVREAGLKSLFFFAKHVLGYKWLQEVPHGRLCHKLEVLTAHLRPGTGVEPPPAPLKKVILEPRKWSKTTVCAHSLPLWLALHNPNIRCLLHSETMEKQAEPMLRVLRDHIENNALFRGLYGNLRGDAKSLKWENKQLIIASRTAVGMREATFTAGAIGTTETGGHFDLIVSDDPVSEHNTETLEQNLKVLDDHRQLSAFLDKASVMILDGTRYAFGDLYGYVLDHPTGWDVEDVHSVETADYDSFYTPEYLEAERDAQGADRFANWYRNLVIDPETAVFKGEWFETWSGEFDDLPAKTGIVAAFDPAVGEKRNSDKVGLVILARAGIGPCQLLEAKGMRITPTRLIEEIFRVQAQYGPMGLKRIGIELVGGFKVLEYWLREEEKRRDTYVVRKELKPGTSADAKRARIRLLAPRYEARQIKHRVGMTDLEEQALRFPLGDDDIIDALAFAVEMSRGLSRESKVVSEEEARQLERDAAILAMRKSKPGELVLPGNFRRNEGTWYDL